MSDIQRYPKTQSHQTKKKIHVNALKQWTGVKCLQPDFLFFLFFCFDVLQLEAIMEKVRVLTFKNFSKIFTDTMFFCEVFTKQAHKNGVCMPLMSM